MGAIPKLFASTFATLGERKAGKVGPKCMFFTPKLSRASNTITAFCSYQAMISGYDNKIIIFEVFI